MSYACFHDAGQGFGAFLSESISIRDTAMKKEKKENLPVGKAITKGFKERNPSVCFYHSMFLGLLRAEGSWIVKSNAESGVGYSDITEYEAGLEEELDKKIKAFISKILCCFSL